MFIKRGEIWEEKPICCTLRKGDNLLKLFALVIKGEVIYIFIFFFFILFFFLFLFFFFIFVLLVLLFLIVMFNKVITRKIGNFHISQGRIIPNAWERLIQFMSSILIKYLMDINYINYPMWVIVIDVFMHIIELFIIPL